MPRAPKKCGNTFCETRVPGGVLYCPTHTPSWQTSSTPRRDQLPPDWPHLRQQVKQRANGQCEWQTSTLPRCPSPGTDCDHIIRGNDHRLHNLQWLCKAHHAAKTAQEGNTARWGPGHHPPPPTR